LSNKYFNSKLAEDIYMRRYSLDGQETWDETCKRVVSNVCGQLLTEVDKNSIYDLMVAKKFIPGGRYLATSGRPFHQTNNCFLFRAMDSREGWSEVMADITQTLMCGGGIGVDYSLLRGYGAKIRKTGGFSSGPMALIHMVNEAGRFIRSGGDRRSAIWAGLNWAHPDIFTFINSKNYTDKIKILKEEDFEFPVPLEGTNISVIYDTEFFIALSKTTHPMHKTAKDVWEKNCKQAFSTAEPGMAFNYLKDNDSLRNACTEVTSEDDSDKCNLGTLWLPKFTDRDDFEKAIPLATKFLMCGGIYSDVPNNKIREVGTKNNRIGLGLGGLHEWLINRDKPYVVTTELHKWLNIYERESDGAAYETAKELNVSIPKGKRAIAPNGTIGIIAECTTGIEPVFCKAYKRMYMEGDTWKYQIIVDPAVKRAMANGIDISTIQDAQEISFKDRVKFQADVQQYVDMAISSTCNLSAWGSENNNEENWKDKSKILLKYAKRLRGFTCYPDGCRSGQPLERMDIQRALDQEGIVFEAKEDVCAAGVCGI